ncbi:hypothetical protein K474DRAFT_1772718 [Panus rudis PR-1116 ss-1]|nr:hypothetical protein K474DRAFT_1772718 [Panus rudis PR-1116 ss-1]
MLHTCQNVVRRKTLLAAAQKAADLPGCRLGVPHTPVPHTDTEQSEKSLQSGPESTLHNELTQQPENTHPTPCQPNSPPISSSDTKPSSPKKMTVAERDAAMMDAWKEREGSLANAQFEDGKAEEGYRRNVKANIFRYI